MIRIISIFFMFILLQPISVKAFDFNKVRNDTIEARFYDPLRRALHHARPARSLLSPTAQIEVTMKLSIIICHPFQPISIGQRLHAQCGDRFYHPI